MNADMYTFKRQNTGEMAGNILLLIKPLYILNNYKVNHTIFFSHQNTK
jgi:hypothetical protein